MRKLGAVLLALAIALPALPAVAADTSSVIKQALDTYGNSIVLVTLAVDNKLGGNKTPMGGQAVCVGEDGIFAATFLESTVRPETLTDIKVTTQGADGKVYAAQFMGLDPVSGLSFFKAEGPAKRFKAVVFADAPKLEPGMQVFSVGMMSGDGNRTAYAGTGYISAMMRVPGPMAYVTGGSLTNVGSVVFTADMQPVGLVGRQLPLTFNTTTPQGQPVNLPLRGEELTFFFIPSSDFAAATKSTAIPKDGQVRRSAWMGVNQFQAITEEQLKTAPELGKPDMLPAVLIDQVIPEGPAAKAGLNDRDIITKVNGQKLENLANPSFLVHNFARQMAKLAVGDKVKLTVVRAGKEIPEVTLTMEKLPMQPGEAKAVVDSGLVLLVRERVMLDQYVNKTLAKGDGMVVEQVHPKGPAAGKIEPNDLITSINNMPVKDSDSYLKAATAAMKQGGMILVGFKRGEVPMAISIKPQPMEPAPAPTTSAPAIAPAAAPAAPAVAPAAPIK